MARDVTDLHLAGEFNLASMDFEVLNVPSNGKSAGSSWLAGMAISGAPEEIPEFLFGRYFPLGYATLVYGSGKAGKTLVVADLVASLTEGRALPDGSKRDTAELVMWISYEETRGKLRRTFRGMGADNGRVFGVCVDSEPAAPLDEKELIAQYLTPAAEEGVRVFVIDNLTHRFVGGLQNDQGAVNALAREYNRFAARYGVVIIALYHTNKQSDASPFDRISGSQAWCAGFRAGLQVTGHDQKGDLTAVWCSVDEASDQGYPFELVRDSEGRPTVKWGVATENDPVAALMRERDARGVGGGTRVSLTKIAGELGSFLGDERRSTTDVKKWLCEMHGITRHEQLAQLREMVEYEVSKLSGQGGKYWWVPVGYKDKYMDGDDWVRD